MDDIDKITVSRARVQIDSYRLRSPYLLLQAEQGKEEQCVLTGDLDELLDRHTIGKVAVPIQMPQYRRDCACAGVLSFGKGYTWVVVGPRLWGCGGARCDHAREAHVEEACGVGVVHASAL